MQHQATTLLQIRSFLKMSIVDISFEKISLLSLSNLHLLKKLENLGLRQLWREKMENLFYIILNATQLPNGNMMAFAKNITGPQKKQK